MLQYSASAAAIAAPAPRSVRGRPLAIQLIRFAVVGAINTFVDLAVLNLLIILTRTGQTGAPFALYKTIAFVCAVLNSYLINRNWTFDRSGHKYKLIEAGQFLFVAILGALINVGSSWSVVTYMHPVSELERWWPSVAALVGTAFSLGFNFIGYKFWVFTSKQSSDHASG